MVFFFVFVGGLLSFSVVDAITIGISVIDATTTGIATIATIVGLVATIYKIVLTGRIGVGRGGIEFCVTGS